MIIASLILLVGVVEDLRTKKVPNTHIIAMAALALAAQLFVVGTSGLFPSLLSVTTAVLIMIPLVMAKVIGAGDMKLLMAFSIVVPWSATFTTAIAALIWGALLGLIKSILSGQFSQLLKTTGAIARGHRTADMPTTQIPYTVALLFGWMTYLSLEFHGGRI